MGFVCPCGSANGYFLHPLGEAGTGTFFHTPDPLPDGAPVFTMTCGPTSKPWLYKHPNPNLIPTSPHCSKPRHPIQPPPESRPPTPSSFQPRPGAVCTAGVQVTRRVTTAAAPYLRPASPTPTSRPSLLPLMALSIGTDSSSPPPEKEDVQLII
jgi:hypothetical protein